MWETQHELFESVILDRSATIGIGSDSRSQNDADPKKRGETIQEIKRNKAAVTKAANAANTSTVNHDTAVLPREALTKPLQHIKQQNAS